MNMPAWSPLFPPAPPVVALVIGLSLLVQQGATAPASVYVSFSSPRISFSHGTPVDIDDQTAHAVPAISALSATPSGLPKPLAPVATALPSSPQLSSLLLSETAVRRSRLVPLVFSPEPNDASEVSTIDLHDLPTVSAVEDVDQELLELPAPAVLARVLEGPLFFGAYPHAASLLRYQRAREAAGLAADRLGSARPESPFYRWKRAATASARGRRRSSSRSLRRTMY